MALPPPPAKANTAAPAAAPTAAPAAAPTAVTENKKIIPKFGPGRGENAIPVPEIGGINVSGLFDVLWNAAVGAIGSPEQVVALVEAYDAVPKDKFPGNKQGRAAYMVGGILKNLNKIHSGGAARKPGEKKPRVKQSDKFKALLGKLAGQVGGLDALKSMLTAEDLKALKIEL